MSFRVGRKKLKPDVPISFDVRGNRRSESNVEVVVIDGSKR